MKPLTLAELEEILERDPEYLREMLKFLRSQQEQLIAAIEAMDAKLEVESSFEDVDGESYVAYYRVPAGPWHKLLGIIRG